MNSSNTRQTAVARSKGSRPWKRLLLPIATTLPVFVFAVALGLAGNFALALAIIFCALLFLATLAYVFQHRTRLELLEKEAVQNARLLDVINRAQNEFILTSKPGPMFERLLESLLQMSGSEYGFIGEVLHTEEGDPYLKTHAITNIAWNNETRAMFERQRAGGMEFFNLDSLFGAALRTQQPVIANDPARDPRSGGMPAGHPPMNAFLGVPFFNPREEMVGLVGIANRSGGYDESIVVFLQPFLTTCGNLIEAYRSELRRTEAEAALVTLNEQLERSSEEAAEQRDFAVQIMNNMGQGLTVVDENGRFTFVNPAFARIVNEEPGALIGRSPEEFTLPDDRGVLLAAGKGRREGLQGSYETRILRADGEIVDALITGVPRFRQKNFVGSIAVITDLTERKLAETALRKSEAEARKLSQVASRTDNLVIITDAAGNIEWVNTAFTRVTGYALDEAVGRRPGHLLQGPDSDPEVIAYMRRQIQKGEGFKVEMLNYARDGRSYWVEIEVQPVHDDQGALTNFVAIETDVTQRKEAQARMEEARAVAEAAAQAKSAFLASMSHEIRTPLNAVIGLNGLLLDTELTETQRQFAVTARDSGNLLLMLVNNVLDFSALESGRVELEERPFSLRRALKETVALLEHQAQRKRLALSYHVDRSVPTVLIGDQMRLRQVLLNLIGNSLKFTDAGSIAIEVSAQTKSRSVRVNFTVRDTGVGIPAGKLERLFQPFVQGDASTTREYGGSGLGLAITRQIVNMMDGGIRVESEPGRGTAVTFDVNMGVGGTALLNEPGPQSGLHEEMGSRWPLRILVVEDDDVNRQVAGHMLERLGYEPAFAGDGAEALEVMAGDQFDVILMDIHMPVMDGLLTTQAIRERWLHDEGPYVIAMTAAAMEGDRERFLAVGMDDYVSKPVQPAALAAALRLAVQSRDESASLRWTPLVAGEPRLLDGETPVDRAAFAERMGAGQEALLHQLIELFLAEAETTLLELKQAIASRDVERVRDVAHRIKGSGASIAAAQVTAYAGALEHQARHGELSAAGDRLKDLELEVVRLQQWHAGEMALMGAEA